MLRFSRTIMLAAAVSTAAVGVSASSAEGSSGAAGPGYVGIRLVDVPVSQADDPRSREYIVDSLAPGVTVHRRVEVANTTDSTVRVQLYPDAADITHGSFVGAPGSTISELTSWTTLSRAAINLPAHSTALDTVSIAVPKDAAPGERYGVVWAATSGGGGPGITLVNRVGVRLYLWVGGDNPPASGFAVETMTASRAADGRAVVQAQVRNTGGRALDMTGTLKLAAVQGSLTAGPYLAQLGTTMAPGQSGPVRATVTDPVADGPWNATFDLRSGIVDRTYQARITFPRRVGTAAVFAAHPQATDDNAVLVVALAATVFALNAFLAFSTARRRLTRRKTAAAAEATLAPDAAEDA